MQNEEYTFTTESYFEYKGVLEMYTIYFYTTYMLINSDILQYSKIQKVSKYKTGLRIITTNKDVLDIPCEQEVKRKIFNFFKCLNENSESVDLNKIIRTAVIKFGENNFLVYMKKHQINLEHFEEFKFFIKESKTLIPLENNSDLGGALFHFNKRLNVFITNEK